MGLPATGGSSYGGYSEVDSGATELYGGYGGGGYGGYGNYN